ncbi:TauD/TfdA dioxygenase family protein [Jannaschia aquimarina]|uniref:TauD protein n=1 Tax=Jannaschia aquimarina TaxID=935700 RepID=A0A0D1D954_9RHOB|nr:TauD/TfdA family dioxygenase [Jannaschia aquimarina]KIT16433.1 Alpha-ketoglutarate-dependent taurine dioxygenase [Jannaschia aquimarina]SNS92217.1 taurine dioxygenase [Jannaschia aquimarina]
MSWHAARCGLDAEEVRRALGETGVVVIEGTGLSDTAFADFLEELGEMTFTAGETPLDHEPRLNFVSNVGRTKPPRSVFHTDTSYVRQPPAFTALKAERIPDQGGETVFANQFDAYERLSPDLKLRLRGARVLHRVTGVDPGEGQETESWHPLFRRHPVSGRTALFLSTPERCVALELADGSRADDLIATLFEHSTDPSREWRHAWRPGDILIWDNRCTLHKGDHSAVVGDRVLHRGMVAGEAPLPAA